MNTEHTQEHERFLPQSHVTANKNVVLHFARCAAEDRKTNASTLSARVCVRARVPACVSVCVRVPCVRSRAHVCVLCACACVPSQLEVVNSDAVPTNGG